LNSFKEHTTGLIEKTKQDAKEKLNEKMLLILHNKCALAHTNVDKSLESIKAFEYEAYFVFFYCIGLH